MELASYNADEMSYDIEPTPEMIEELSNGRGEVPDELQQPGDGIHSESV